MTGLPEFFRSRPRLMAWAVLAIVMVAILLWASSGVGLLPSQLFAMVVATVILAGACVWIVGWE